MKISKSLLSAIVIGIAVQATTTSCTKDKEPNDARAKQEAFKSEKNKTTPTTYPENCPACGMG
jgi:hypothetical protein